MTLERGHLTRREFLVLGSALTASCASTPTAGGTTSADGRLASRPSRAAPAQPLAPGEHTLGLGDGRDGFIRVPRGRSGTVPLLVLLHGAGGSAKGLASRLGPLADERGLAVLAPDSRGRTWDVVRGAFGPDVTFVDAALAHTFDRVAVDRSRIAIGGFSDGASYALSLGLVNGDLFTYIVAFSPGFLVADQTHGKPAIYISHGTRDAVLPIDSTSRRLVPRLRNTGYSVQYREFDGPHAVPQQIAEEGLDWIGSPAAAGFR